MSITLDGTLGITAPTYGGSVTAEYSVPVTGFKNRIINGAMVIDQRNAGASGTASQYTVDRWSFVASQASKLTWQQNAGSVTPPNGFTNYFGFTSSSSYSITSSDYFYFQQAIEGYNVADLGFGTANAKTITLSFWVRSSLTGTFGGAIQNSGSTRTYPFSYTISSANTWTQISITISGDTTGTWVTNNGLGLSVFFSLGMGSTYSGTANTWSSTNYISTTGATSVVGTNGATFYITGVQLEKGSTATSFDYRPYGTELALCQRYYEKSYNIDVAPATSTNAGRCEFSGASDGASNQITTIRFKVSKRTAPTMNAWSYTGTANIWDYGRAVGSSTATTNFVYTGTESFAAYVNVGATWTVSTMIGHWAASAEL